MAFVHFQQRAITNSNQSGQISINFIVVPFFVFIVRFACCRELERNKTECLRRALHCPPNEQELRVCGAHVWLILAWPEALNFEFSCLPVFELWTRTGVFPMKVLSFVLVTAGLFTYFLDNTLIKGKLNLACLINSIFSGWEAEMEGSGFGGDPDDDLEINPPAQYKLEAFLMKHYNNRILPRRNPNKPVEVRFRMSLYQIVEVNEPMQYLM
jgi:hypothetical protein